MLVELVELCGIVGPSLAVLLELVELCGAVVLLLVPWFTPVLPLVPGVALVEADPWAVLLLVVPWVVPTAVPG